MINIETIIFIIYYFYILIISVSFIYKNKQKNIFTLWLSTIFMLLSDVFSYFFTDNTKTINFILINSFSFCIFFLFIYRFISFIIKNNMLKNKLNNLNYNKNKYNIFIIFICISILLVFTYSIIVSVFFNIYIENKSSWVYYPIYIMSIGFNIIIFPFIMFFLKEIYNNMYECYIIIITGSIRTILVIYFNIFLDRKYIFLITNFIIIHSLYFFNYQKYKKNNIKDNNEINNDKIINNEINNDELFITYNKLINDNEKNEIYIDLYKKISLLNNPEKK